METKVHLVGRKSVKPTEIVFLKADANYTEVHLEDGEQIIVSKTLKEMEKVFNNFTDFFRTHKSYMVNMAHVNSVRVNGGDSIARMVNNAHAYISRRKKDAFITALRSYK